MRHDFLMIPGPVEVDEEVLEALGRPVPAHYGAEWAELYARVCDRMRQLFGTEGEVHLVYASGMAAMEMSVASLLSPGDAILVADNGTFGARMVEVAAAAGLRPVRLAGEFGRPITGSMVETAIAANPGLRALAIVHHETSAGLINDVRGACAVARREGLLTIVDGISAVGGVEFAMDQWQVDICATVANKAIGGPVGVAPIAAGPRALAALEDGRPKAAGWYLNLATWRRYAELWRGHHPHPTTMPSNVIVALDVALDRLFAVGPDEHRARFARAAARVRDGLGELGFEMLIDPEWASPVCTAALPPRGFDVPAYMEWLREEHGIRIGGGLGPREGKLIRVGHMGKAADPGAVDRFLGLTSDFVAGRP